MTRVVICIGTGNLKSEVQLAGGQLVVCAIYASDDGESRGNTKGMKRKSDSSN